MNTKNQASTGSRHRQGGGQTPSSADTANTAAKKTASSFEMSAQEIIENQPYTAVGIALAVGWLLGRTHHPF
jgi:ElaB/YqjD/DUF883 family membrane-anchored ribosome-binding protein